ncbi:ribosomal protein S16 domain-containing protein [Lentinula raphanica]|nr:ribosomal protein S16 domain-containing protein [Lentinula raphanica]
MPMRLRLAVHGLRHDRVFHLVAINQRTRRDGKPTELLGIYDPRVKPGGKDHKTMEWSVGRIRYWLDVGAIPSKSVVKLLTLGNILKPGSPYHPKSLNVMSPSASASSTSTPSSPVTPSQSTSQQS